jgi:hypothetical protein
MGENLANGADRRRNPRLRLQMPMFLRGTNAQGEEFLELAKTLDISSCGAYLACSRLLRMNDLVSLTIPAPPPTHNGLVPAGTPPMQARIRRVERAGDVNLLGVEFAKPIG